MYLTLLKLLGGLCILTTFWSGVRVLDISVFEWFALLFVGAGALYPPQVPGKDAGFKAFKLVFAGLCVMTLAGIVSAPGSFNMIGSLTKAAKLVAAFMLTIGVGYVSVTRRLFDLTQTLRLLAISAAVCSMVAVMQGQAHMLMQFVPKVVYGEGFGRMTGLSEHPIEMGLVSAYGVAASLGLAIQTRKWLLPSLMIAIDAYSTRFSASLTAVLAMALAVVLICLYTRQFKALVAGGVGATVVTAVVLVSGTSGSALLLERVNLLFASGGNYQTVQTREAQLSFVLQNIGPGTLIVGNGYSESDLPYKMEIHNGILASIYHFGVLGVIAQFLMIGFILSRMSSDATRAEKCALLGCILIFLLAYLSGPPQARPSLWAPPLFLAALLSSPRRKAEPLSSDALFGRLNEPVPPHP